MRVTVREILYQKPKLYVIAVDGKRWDSRLTKRKAMAVAKALAAGEPIEFCTFHTYNSPKERRERDGVAQSADHSRADV